MLEKKSPLRVLADIISEAVNHIDNEYSAAQLEFPSLKDVFDPKDPANVLLSDAQVIKNTSLVVAAAEQLVASIRAPVMVAGDLGLVHLKSSCLQAATVGCVSEILREAGSKGSHVNEISEKNGMDPRKLSRVLRLLAINHVFTEVEPNVFANNRISSILDTKKPSDTIVARSQRNVNKFVETDGVAALVEYDTEDVLKAGAFMTDNLINPKTSRSHEPTDSPLNLAFGTSDSFYEWMNGPENEYRRNRFDIAMRGSGQTESRDAVLRGFPWETLPDGSKVVDVGGGIGAVSLQVAKKFPRLRFIVQDLVIGQTEPFWNEQIPGSVESGKLVVQKHDFFTRQPVKDADIFLVRGVIHNWPLDYAIRILRHLRDAAVPGKTRLLMIDQIINYACKGGAKTEIPGSAPPEVPEPLLPNLGAQLSYLLDLLMLVIQHGQERTLDDHIVITKDSGWNIIRVYSPPGSSFQHILAEAV